MKQNYNLNYSLVTSSLLLNLLLLSCGNLSNQPVSSLEEDIKNTFNGEGKKSEEELGKAIELAQAMQQEDMEEEELLPKTGDRKRKRTDNQEEKGKNVKVETVKKAKNRKENKEERKNLTREKEEYSPTKITLEELPEEILCYLMDFEDVRWACVGVNKKLSEIACSVHTNIKSKSDLYKYISDRKHGQGYGIPRVTIGYPLNHKDLDRYIDVNVEIIALQIKNCNQLSNYSQTIVRLLSKLGRLRYLKLAYLKDLRWDPLLSGLRSLSVLHLDYCDLYATNLKMFSNLSNLTKLSLSGNHALENTDSLANLTKLVKLDLSGCGSNRGASSPGGIKDISALSSLTNLTWLGLTNCESIRDISILSRLTKLTRLSLSGFSNPNLCCLSRLTRLTGLNLGRCTFCNIDDIYNLYQLTYLNLTDIRCHSCLSGRVDISIIAGFRNLTCLNIAGCQWLTGKPQNFEPISYLTQLTSLSLSLEVAKKYLNLLKQLKSLQTIILYADGSIRPYKQLRGEDIHGQLSKELENEPSK